MTKTKLYPGMTCLHGHFIRTKADLSYSWDKSIGKTRARCKQCKAKTDHNRDLRRPRIRYNLLDAGRCRAGHQILSEADVYIQGAGTLKPRYRCRKCQRGPVPTHVGVECGHQVYFKPPLPEKGDIILCVRCEDYRMVKEIL